MIRHERRGTKCQLGFYISVIEYIVYIVNYVMRSTIDTPFFFIISFCREIILDSRYREIFLMTVFEILLSILMLVPFCVLHPITVN